ncbi:MAG: Translation elongation factor P Lys34--(R)-beta-lysine ligase, partial [uncultured Acetobacteraceae bacterium]
VVPFPLAPRTLRGPVALLAAPRPARRGDPRLLRRPRLRGGRDPLLGAGARHGGPPPRFPQRVPAPPRRRRRARIVAPHVAGAGVEAPAGRGRRPGVRAGAGLAQRRGRPAPRAGVHHVGVVPAGPLLQRADGRDGGVRPRRLPARCRARGRRDRPSPAFPAPSGGGGLRRVLRRARHPRHGGRRGAAARRSAPRRRPAARGRGLGRPVLPPAPGTGRTAHRPRPRDLPHPLAGAASGARAARPGRPACRAALRAVRRRRGTRQRLRRADGPRRAARALRARRGGAPPPLRRGRGRKLGGGRGLPPGAGARDARGQRHRARLRPAGDARLRRAADRRRAVAAPRYRV